MQYKRILVATDFSVGSEAAIKEAKNLAALDASWFLAHVVTGAPPPSGAAKIRRIRSGAAPAHDPVRTRLQEFARRTGLGDAVLLVERGPVAPTLATLETTQRADLLVVGASNSRNSLVAGSVARAVLRYAKGDVLVGRPPRFLAGHAEGTIAATTDLQPHSIPGLRFVADPHIPYHRRLAWHVVDAADWTHPVAASLHRSSEAMGHRVTPHQIYEATVAALARHLPPDVAHVVDAQVLSGSVRTSLERAVQAHRVQLLVVGTGGPRLEASIGSVATDLVDGLPCSVLVVRS